MCTELLPPGVNPIAVNKYIISYHILSHKICERRLVVYHYSYYSMDWNLILTVTLQFNISLIVA